MVVDKYVGRCLDVGSTPTGSIMNRYTVDFFCLTFGVQFTHQRFFNIMEPVGVEPTSKHLLTYLSTTIGYVLF